MRTRGCRHRGWPSGSGSGSVTSSTAPASWGGGAGGQQAGHGAGSGERWAGIVGRAQQLWLQHRPYREEKEKASSDYAGQVQATAP